MCVKDIERKKDKELPKIKDVNGGKATMNYIWEGSHFKENAWDIVNGLVCTWVNCFPYI